MGQYPEPDLSRNPPMRLSTLLLLSLSLLLAACSREPALEPLLERVEALQHAIENRQTDTAIDMLSDDFVTGKGQNRKDAQRLLLFHTMRHQSITILRTQTDAEFDAGYRDRAIVRFNAIVTGGKGWLPEQGRSYRVESRWQFSGGDWYLAELDWEPLL